MVYMIFIIDHIHRLKNESKMLIFAYNNDWSVYMFTLILIIKIINHYIVGILRIIF